MLLQLRTNILARFDALLKCHEHSNCLALQIIWASYGCGLGNLGMTDEGTLDFNRTQTVPRYVDHVVDAAHDPVITVRITTRIVAGQVFAGDLGPILLLESVVVSPNPSQHPGPRMCDTEHAAISLFDW